MPRETEKIVQLRPGIFQIRGERTGSHVYLIRGHTKNLLIDTGMAESFSELNSALAYLGLQPENIHLIILTHEHFDHIGACAFFYETAAIAAHRLAANKIELQDEFVMMNRLFGLPACSIHADIWLEGDTRIDLGNYRLRVLHTPGHCSGCICLYEPDHKLLFTGDTVLAGGVLSGVLPSGSISDYVNSLERLNCLQIKELYPGHGRVSSMPEEDLKKAVENAHGLLEESRILFDTLDTKSTFTRLFKAIRRFPRPERG